MSNMRCDPNTGMIEVSLIQRGDYIRSRGGTFLKCTGRSRNRGFVAFVDKSGNTDQLSLESAPVELIPNQDW